MGIGATTHQKATIGEIVSNGLADQGRGLPAALHLVVVPSFGAIKTQLIGGLNQDLKGQSVAGRVGQQGQTPCRPDRFQHRFRPQSPTDQGRSLQIGIKAGVVVCEAKGQNMDQAAVQQAADLHPRPEFWGGFARVKACIKDGLHRGKSLVGVVIGDRDLLQTHGEGLVGQLLGVQAAITAVGVAMEVEATGTAPRPYSPQDRGEGMVPLALAPGLAFVDGLPVESHWFRTRQRGVQPAGGANGHKTESSPP